ncbi:hypothetical protein J3Q64DRAFT_1643589 [Phycomyces blakesleeanus]|uniref:NADH:flavin oxidoreductase/NADH oxidase N-terminal domain-containing protein n=2 Tax=Phycomyces blakesleeanus TaxID=4837 RepID=A0A162VBK8_PHYB8|nr:hypothetical protein PHYBLDRAFT_154056 [Phycomyces blakesleeanus NRRL 1555(-)]OAD81452.1 hypothetical protein PHYBLDRAFT_154056 [Phycomyces blakesleeanus NRRL 1555(-)]|eukprot:XP_018299492.1 hypothetical protein PHYBLDRAFT_154056 [Phycomyces blakesleeanus NRRL 1555(-)]
MNPAGVPFITEEAEGVKLFQPITCKSVTLHNRVVVSPMCLYSAEDGILNDFHSTHYGAMATRGAGLIIVEATAVEPQGRITPSDSGLWKDEQIEPLKRIVNFIKSQGTVPGIQIAHAGRKASTLPPFIGDGAASEEEGGWPEDVRSASELKFADHYCQPNALSQEGINEVVQKWADAAVRADEAGFEVLEIHSAHGYLLHNFLSGNSNNRTDEYGGSLDNRMRFPLEVAKAVRAVWPDHKPLWLRLSATDYANPDPMGPDENGWDIFQSVEYAKKLKEIGIDVIDASSGANLSTVGYPPPSLFQIDFAEKIKREAEISTAGVGYICTGKQAEEILQDDKADYTLIGREYLRRPTWVMDAGKELDVDVTLPKQYTWALRMSRHTNKSAMDEYYLHHSSS